jgi:E3 Ubiquitin ligase
MTDAELDYWFILIGLAACSGYSFWYSFKSWRKNRTIGDTPASRVRSAAQGYVELDGVGMLPPGSTNKSPLTGTPCTWWSYQVEERDREGWSTIDSETSAAPFLLDDGTGQCLVDPRGAEVIPRATHVWYGPEAWPRGRVPQGRGVFGRLIDRIFTGKYRYTERRLQPRERVCAIGVYRSVGDGPEADVAAAELLREWKRDQAALLARFDGDRDGRLSEQEWDRARAAAQRQVEDARAAAPIRPSVNMLVDPMDGRAFVLAARDAAALARGFRRRALLGLIGFVGSSAALTWMLTYV